MKYLPDIQVIGRYLFIGYIGISAYLNRQISLSADTKKISIGRTLLQVQCCLSFLLENVYKFKGKEVFIRETRDKYTMGDATTLLIQCKIN